MNTNNLLKRCSKGRKHYFTENIHDLPSTTMKRAQITPSFSSSIIKGNIKQCCTTLHS